ncbi:DNA polymerase-3 subunit beta [Herbihabitans rhizosphaerae]|uniref:DNA polymerase-3 subunit beta n=1 Tax=Herbihabitans rhizosphaerae TaxID=1872711 RepID=A0A4Q7KYZ3_9PSEU|nr:DNA polymerase III subunit beta [Herbihabitans rhizosphaerae]RZS41291.1 DNA polymerase-3 subunit beta [Herbihabitans rhizosphaerae]
MDVTATTAELAAAAADAVRLVPGRMIDPVLSGLLITADADGILYAATDRERSARVRAGATVHTEGRVLVPAKPLAETLRALEQPDVRLVVEGARLAIRAPGARFALPLLDADSHPGVPEPPAVAGEVDAVLFATALATVAATASRDDALPLFTGVRLRSDRVGDGERLALLATDRFRMAIASVPWTCRESGQGELDALIPASLLAEAAKQLPASGRVVLHADEDRIGLSWDGVTATTSLLDGAFLSESKVVMSEVDTTVELDADALAGAVRRVGLYTDPRGVLTVEIGENEVRLRGADATAGEAEESVKSTVDGGRTSPSFQARFLSDALRPFSGRRITLAIQPGMRATVITAVEPDEVDLRYVVMPMLPPKA